ncbi:MAG: hypothetical protein JXB18_09870 [Sedimentisphaerales bacterium]|nr:hypothetical protein [Sedimentisphaerales bacterium]
MKRFYQQWFMNYAIILFLFISIESSLFAADLTITVDSALPIRTIPMTLYGGNLTAWDGAQNGSNATFNNLLKASGRKYMRWCGGSWGDAYLWSDMEGPNKTKTWIVSYSETLNLLNLLSQPGETVHPTLQPIVNFPGIWYGIQHTHQEAVAAAVAWVTDQSARTPTAQYWEIGNETVGPWEAGYFEGISGTYYGDYFADFYLGMKAVNPGIKIGANVEPYHGLQPWGWYEGYWTYDTLVAASAKGAIPDFLIIHQYPGDGEPASYNPTLLNDRINEIAQFTSNLDGIVADALGPEHVGQIRYWMTEWDAGNDDNDAYRRRQAYVNAMFHVQYVMEMAKHNWEGANAWAQWEYNSSYFVYPVWYVHPMLMNRFGQEMVEVTDTHSLVRAYGAIDAVGNLTILAVNNSPTQDLTADINIVGFPAAAGGLQWLAEPAGNLVAGGVNIQDMDNIQINGTVHPDPLNVKNLAGQNITTANSFSVSLPKSSILFLTIPKNEEIDPDNVPPSPNPMNWAVRPHVSAGGSIAMEAMTASDLNGVHYYFECTSGGGHDSGWQSSPIYEDTGLTAGNTYTYTVKARDLSAQRNETMPSPSVSVTMISPLTSTLTLMNPSFENGKIGWFFDPDGKFYTDSSQSTDGDWALHAGWYTGVPEVYFYTNGIWQDMDYTIQNNELFVLKFDYWSENGWGSHEVNADISYYNPNNAGDTGLIATTKFVTGGATSQWMTFTLSADASTVPAAVGKKLRIRFRPMGYHWSYYKFDSVRLYQSVYNPVPALWAHSVGPDQNLSWTSAEANWQSKGWTFDVYLSEDYAQVNAMNANTRVVSGLSENTYHPTDLSSNTGYFWRVVTNERKAGGAIVRHPGPVWYLTSQYQWLYGDFNGDGLVSGEDIADFAHLWLINDCILTSGIDMDGNCIVNLHEFSRMAQNWMKN